MAAGENVYIKPYMLLMPPLRVITNGEAHPCAVSSPIYHLGCFCMYVHMHNNARAQGSSSEQLRGLSAGNYGELQLRDGW